MKYIILILLSLTLPSALIASPNWNRDNYKVLDHSSFRRSEDFKKQVDYNNIDHALMNAAIFFVTNEQRAKKKLEPLEYVEELEAAAWHHSKQMAEKNFFSHTNSKDKLRKSCEDRVKLAGIVNPSIAENIAYTTEENETYLEVATRFVDMWMRSEGHRENILAKSALQMGCGAYHHDGKWYATQDFQWFSPAKAGGKVTDKLP